MVRKVTMQSSLDFAEPEAVFNILFGSDEFIKRYHKKINCDPHAEVSSWDKNHEREVKYLAVSEAPKMITRLTGESFPVREAQKYTKNDDCYTIMCTPRIDSPSGDRFVTHAETILLPAESGKGCVIMSNIMLEFKGGLWGLDGAIESFMESRAKTGFEQWMTIANSFCQEKLGLAGAHENGYGQECFFDAQEASDDPASSVDTQAPNDHSTPVNGILQRLRAAFSASMGNTHVDNTHTLDSYFMQTVLREINDIQMSCNALKGHVEKLNAEMLKMEGDISHVRQTLERQHIVISRRKQWTLLGGSFAAGFGLGFLYMRMKRQT